MDYVSAGEAARREVRDLTDREALVGLLDGAEPDVCIAVLERSRARAGRAPSGRRGAQRRRMATPRRPFDAGPRTLPWRGRDATTGRRKGAGDAMRRAAARRRATA